MGSRMLVLKNKFVHDSPEDFIKETVQHLILPEIQRFKTWSMCSQGLEAKGWSSSWKKLSSWLHTDNWKGHPHMWGDPITHILRSSHACTCEWAKHTHIHTHACTYWTHSQSYFILCTPLHYGLFFIISIWNIPFSTIRLNPPPSRAGIIYYSSLVLQDLCRALHRCSWKWLWIG